MDQQGPPPFEEGVTQVLVFTEELKRSLGITRVVQWQVELENIVERLDFLFRLCLDAPEDDVKKDLYNHCRQKTKTVAWQVLQHVSKLDVEEQGAVARMVELSLIIHNNMATSKDDSDYATQVIDLYVSYQRFVLRQRAKPAIAYLAQWRQQDEETRIAALQEEEADNDDETCIARPHAHAMTIILGQGSALVHPLFMWKTALPEQTVDLRTMCDKAIEVLDEQAQTLVKTVSDWFWTDRKVDEWMNKVAATDSGDSSAAVDLVELDALVEEMAFASQLLARYQSLLKDVTCSTLVEQELLPEWTWKYACLERFLGRQQWKSALNMACPVSIVMGMSIQVPSVVEDAQYLSTRALERATSTLSQQAMGTVAHSISNDVWSTDVDGGVHQALLDQRGCWAVQNEVGSSKVAEAPKSNGSSSFASALLGALDDDLQTTSPPVSKATPQSGGFLGSLVGEGPQQQQIRLDMQLCQLNGIHSAAAACTSLSKSLEEDEDDVVKTSSMIHLAREELLRYSHAYQVLLKNQIQDVINEWCGSLQGTNSQKNMCLHVFRDLFQRENYELNATTFSAAEADERLDREMLGPLQHSRFIENLSKCDGDVAYLLCKELSCLLSTLLLECLWYDKKFTDWGSLLLSKQVRMLQTYLSSLVEENAMHTAGLLNEWQRVAQAVTLLQLEKPSDWAAYQNTDDVLTNEEVKRTLGLRVDFSSDAIAAVCGNNDEADSKVL
jgi:hypothetical protein